MLSLQLEAFVSHGPMAKYISSPFQTRLEYSVEVIILALSSLLKQRIVI